jgi:hypothetical protein
MSFGADFWALGVDQQGDFIANFSYGVDDFEGVVRPLVGGVEPDDVDSCLVEFFQVLHIAASVGDCGDNLG